MLRRLAVNTFITGTAFLVTGFVPLLLVPLFVAQYGVADYGLLVLVRLLLPTGALAFLDLGKSEVSAFAVAQARHDGDWARCGRRLTVLLWLAAGIGVTAAALLAVSSGALASLFHVSTASRPGFDAIVLATSAVFPALLAALVADGIVKGFEDFKRLRLIEVATTFAYAAAAVAVVLAALPYQWIAFAYLGYALVRAALVAVQATRLLASQRATLQRPGADDWREVRRRCAPLGVNRAIGVVQGYAATLLIGALLGSAAVGIYDLVTRIPRFLKVVTGILNSAVLPTVLRLDAAADRAGVRRVLDLGLLGVVCIVAAVVAWGMSFSEAILRLWIGDSYARLWQWQALMFAWPLANAMTSFTCGALLGRPHFVHSLNRIALAQIVLQLALSFALLPLWREQAFVAAQIAVVLASLPLQLRLVARECGLAAADFKRHATVVALFALAVATCLSLGLSGGIANRLELVLSLVAWMVVSAAAIVFGVLSNIERAKLLSMFGRQARPAA
jgi:O-antigen/teichoic acid export membrane protein